MSVSGMDNVLSGTISKFDGANTVSADLESVVDNLSELIWSIDLTQEPYQITYYNSPFGRELYKSTFGTFPRTIEDLQKNIHEDDIDRVLEEFVNALSRGKGGYAYRIKRKDGGYHYFRDRLSVLYQGNRPVRLDGVTIDIDLIRRNRVNLELSQQRLKSIVDALPDPVFISEKASGTVIFANEVLFSVYGMSPEDFLGQKVTQFYRNFSGRKEYIHRLRTEGHVQNHELVLRNKKDEEYWVSASSMPLEFDDMDCYITILQDITFRKQLESEINESNERYQLAIEGTNDVIWEYDFQRGTSYLSPQFWEGMALSPEENPLDQNLLLKYLHPEDYTAFLKLYESKIENTELDFTIESRLLANKGKVIWALIKARIIYNDQSEPVRVVGSMTNVTTLKLAQSKLRESEAKYKLISEHSRDCICLQNVSGDFVFVSPSSLDILGYQSVELLTINLHRIISPYYLHQVSDEMLKVLNKEEKSVNIIFEAIHKEGYKVWLETTGGAIFDDNGDVLYLQTSTRDVTERILAEEKLRESEERYKLITENSHDIVSLMDLEGNYVFISPSIKETMGYDPIDFIGQNTLEFIHPDDKEQIEKNWAYTIQNGIKDIKGKFRFRHKDGSWRWIEATGGVITDEEGQPIYIRSNKIDITENLITQEKLKLQEEKYKLVSENSGDVIGLHKLGGQLVFISPSCLRLVGYSESELRGSNPIELIREEQRELILQIIEKTALNKGKDVKMTYEIQTKEGKWIWVETSLTSILNSNGEADLLQSSTRDISERIEALEKEKQLNKLKSSFISMASHEFRTPLTTIQSSNELISMYIDQSDSKAYQKLGKHVLRIRTELERLNSLLKDVFTLGRLDVGKAKLNKDMTSLIGIVRRVIVESKIQYPDREVKLDIRGDEIQMNLDSQLISHALSNLLMNAIKYSEGQSDPVITITYGVDEVMLSVQDYGIGIPQKDQANLFESFSRASNVGDIEGTGLGLVIVRQFIEMHQGKVEVHSEENQGAEFVIKLPVISEIKA